MTENSVRYALPELINMTDKSIISKIHTHSLQGFSSYLKDNYISQYKSDCTIHHCYVCGHN